MTALIEIKRSLARLPARIPYGITVLDVEIAAAGIHGHTVVAVARYAAELGILAETVTSRSI